MPTLLKKWWVILLQGILLIIIGFIFINNPVAVLAGISFWIGLLTLVTGLIGVISHFMVHKDERESGTLLWSIITLFFGLLMINKLGLTMKVITIFFGLWMLMTGLWLTSTGWQHRGNGFMGWLMLLAGIVSILAGIAVIFNLGTGAIWISTLLGIQALVAGTGLIFLAFAKRHVVTNIKANRPFSTP